MSDAPRISLIAIDVDGTLTPGDNVLSAATRAALQQATGAGLEVVLATGRRYRTTRIMLERIGLPLSAVCLGGALTKGPDAITLATDPLAGDDAAAIIELTRELSLSAILQHDAPPDAGADYTIDDVLPWHDATRFYFDLAARVGRAGDAQRALESRDALVIGLYHDRGPLQALADAIHARYPSRFMVTIVPAGITDAWYCEIVRADVSKWTAVAALAARSGHAPDAICAIGDQLNDLPMLRGAAYAVAMGNAPAQVKAVADEVTTSAAEDGVAAAIDRLLERQSGGR